MTERIDPAELKKWCALADKLVREEMRAEGYREFLRGKGWKRAKARTLARYPRCLLCPGRSERVHHYDPEVRSAEGAGAPFFVPLCRACHDGLTTDGERRVLATRRVNAALEARAAGTSRGRGWLRSLARAKDRPRRGRNTRNHGAG